jgi:hypothetical protein
MSKSIAVGDRVKYSARFCRSSGAYTGALPHARGKVVKLLTVGPGFVLATIEWDHQQGKYVPGVVNVANLAHEKDPEHASV